MPIIVQRVDANLLLLQGTSRYWLAQTKEPRRQISIIELSRNLTCGGRLKFRSLLNLMWKRIDTPLKRSQISDYSFQSIKSGPKDSRIVLFLFIWASIVTVLLFYQIGFPSDSFNVDRNDNSAVTIGSSLRGKIK